MLAHSCFNEHWQLEVLVPSSSLACLQELRPTQRTACRLASEIATPHGRPGAHWQPRGWGARHCNLKLPCGESLPSHGLRVIMMVLDSARRPPGGRGAEWQPVGHAGPGPGPRAMPVTAHRGAAAYTGAWPAAEWAPTPLESETPGPSAAGGTILRSWLMPVCTLPPWALQVANAACCRRARARALPGPGPRGSSRPQGLGP
jgi:hypothetical protein